MQRLRKLHNTEIRSCSCGPPLQRVDAERQTRGESSPRRELFAALKGNRLKHPSVTFRETRTFIFLILAKRFVPAHHRPRAALKPNATCKSRLTSSLTSGRYRLGATIVRRKNRFDSTHVIHARAEIPSTYLEVSPVNHPLMKRTHVRLRAIRDYSGVEERKDLLRKMSLCKIL